MIRDEVAESWKEITALCASLEKSVAFAERCLTQGAVLFGAGPHGRAAARFLRKRGARVLCFADNDPVKQGTLIESIRVVSPRDSSVTQAPIVLIAARHAVRPVRRQLDEMSINSLSFDAFFAAENMPRIAHVRNELLRDDRSRLSYDGIIKAMLTGDKIFCASVMEGNQYFALPEFVNIGSDHFVDAGAYVGDTVEKFIFANNGVFNEIYAFEPGLPQLAALRRRVQRLRAEWAIPESKITCEHAGLSDEDKEMRISLTPGMLQCTSIGGHTPGEEAEEAGTVWVRSLDRYLAGRPATFIKADIEGMEMAMLRGARETIRKFRPKMAISIYHEPLDLFEIAELIISIVPEYQMAVRHHAPVLMDSVLYCWIRE
jgi:FkbM family methyltransferase